MANFKDTGQYYANEEMQKEFIMLSMNSRLIYDTTDLSDVKIIKKTTDEFYAIAEADILDNDHCFYSQASVYRSGEGRLEWEF